MSHFVSMEVCYRQKYEKDLVKALEEQFGEGKVEVHPEGAALLGYGGDDRSKLSTSNANYAPKCHIIIRRKHVGSASNDVGYVRTEDGGYRAYISDYDQGNNFSKVKQNKVTQGYSVRVSEKELKTKGYTWKKVVQKDGTIKLMASKFVK